MLLYDPHLVILEIPALVVLVDERSFILSRSLVTLHRCLGFMIVV
jgi:hypothetical protein